MEFCGEKPGKMRSLPKVVEMGGGNPGKRPAPPLFLPGSGSDTNIVPLLYNDMYFLNSKRIR